MPKAYRLLASLLRAAVEEGSLVRTPCIVKGAGKEQAGELNVPSVAEVEALAAATREEYRAMVLLGAWCSLRYGELAALRRKQIDLVHGEVRVRATVTELRTGERVAAPPKSAAGVRDVSIPPHLVAVMEEHLERHVGPAPDALVFPAPEGGYLSRVHFRQRVWLPACQASGVRYRFHDLCAFRRIRPPVPALPERRSQS